MESAESKAARYERAYPGTGVGTAQAAERVEREDVKARKANHEPRRRFHVMPALPWHKDE